LPANPSAATKAKGSRPPDSSPPCLTRNQQLKSETFAASMRQPLKPMVRGESITGKLVIKHDLPGGLTLVLVDDDKGTLHRGIVRGLGDVRSGAKVTLEINRAARVTLSLGLEQSRGRGMRR
jgi:hypothetical protein